MTSPTHPDRRRAWLAALGLAAALAPLVMVFAPAACKKPAAPPPTLDVVPEPATRLLTVDGIDVTFGDIAAEVSYLDALAPEWSLKTKIRRVLEEIGLPLMFARRDFASERAEQRKQAEQLIAVSGNARELLDNARLRPHSHQQVTRRDVPIPVSAFLFTPETTLGVSGPLELPQGYVVAAALDLKQSSAVMNDLCEALQVAFYTHPTAEYNAWWAATQERAGTRVTYVHPDLRDNLPPWLKLP